MTLRCGFTLLELMLAMALSAILMVGVLGVVSNVGGLSTLEAASRNADPAVEAMMGVIGSDLQQARTVEPIDNGVRLTGPLALDKGANRTHRPAEVTFTVEPIAGRSCVVRRQLTLDELTSANARSDLVYAGVVAMRFRPTEAAPLFAGEQASLASLLAAFDTQAATTADGAAGAGTDATGATEDAAPEAQPEIDLASDPAALRDAIGRFDFRFSGFDYPEWLSPPAALSDDEALTLLDLLEAEGISLPAPTNPRQTGPNSAAGGASGDEGASTPAVAGVASGSGTNADEPPAIQPFQAAYGGRFVVWRLTVATADGAEIERVVAVRREVGDG